MSQPSNKFDRQRTIAIRIWDWSEWCRQVVRGIQRYAHDQPGWRLYVDVGQTTRPQVFSGQFSLDGIITHVVSDVRAIRKMLDADRMKIVAFATSVPDELSDLPGVRVDDAKVAGVIGRHLASGGFRRLAYCGSGNPGSLNDARSRGLRAFAVTSGYSFDVFQQRGSKRAGVHLPTLERWVATLPKPIGIVTWNIELARTVAQACARANVALPEQAAVVAWDDDPMLAETLEPTISAAVLPAERLGFEAARLLHRLFSGETPREPVVIEPPGLLRVRQSSDVSALKDREVHLALQFIREHAAEPLEITQVARHVAVSRRKLELDFARVVNHTPQEAVRMARFELAKRMLLETDWRTSKVAERSGIGAEATLRRWFVARERTTPGEYRDRFRALRI